jgi:hypothetical protein
MCPPEDLIALEQRGWHALASSGAAACEFYGEVLDDEAAMLLPGGLLLTDREQILQSMTGAPWESFRIENPRVLQATPDTGAVIYGVVARREGTTEYSALVSSLYVRRAAGWRLTLHQQTPRS